MGIHKINAPTRAKEKARTPAMEAKEEVSKEAMGRRECRRPRRQAKEEARIPRAAMGQLRAEVKAKVHVGHAAGHTCNGIAPKVKEEVRATAMDMAA